MKAAGRHDGGDPHGPAGAPKKKLGPLPAELLKQLRAIEFRTQRLANQQLSGTYSRHINEDYKVQGRSSKYFKIGDTIVVAEIEDTASVSTDKPAPEPAKGKDASLGMAVLKKIVELYGGVVDVTSGQGNKYTLTFKINRG